MTGMPEDFRNCWYYRQLWQCRGNNQSVEKTTCGRPMLAEMEVFRVNGRVNDVFDWRVVARIRSTFLGPIAVLAGIEGFLGHDWLRGPRGNLCELGMIDNPSLACNTLRLWLYAQRSATGAY